MLTNQNNNMQEVDIFTKCWLLLVQYNEEEKNTNTQKNIYILLKVTKELQLASGGEGL